MRRTRLLTAIALIIGSASLAWSQAAPSGTLSAALRTHLQNEEFAIVTSVRGLPLGVREEMQTIFRSPTLDIAEPGAPFQQTDVLVVPQLPIRRLVAAGCSRDFHCLVYYQRGGIATTWYVMLFRWTPDATRFEWGGAPPGGLKTIEDVQKAVLSGTAKGHTGPW